MCPSKDGFGSVNHRNTVSLVPSEMAISPLFSWVPANDAKLRIYIYIYIPNT